MCTDFTAFLFDEKQLQGTKQGLCGSTYFAGLPFNNKASSGRSQNLLCTYRLFDAANATGSYTALSPGERDNDFSNDTVGNNRVSSVQKVC
ncbi:hypothetical protein GCM10009550_58810 [Actinocorallia libanotica]|uniref:CUB domain-containing protein n=2 Tax=Actinocorallia libanotica TaxID=46162 RepID=A0ABN1RTH2_9ACTN